MENDAGAATTTSCPAAWHALANGTIGPKWPEPAVVETSTRISGSSHDTDPSVARGWGRVAGCGRVAVGELAEQGPQLWRVEHLECGVEAGEVANELA